MHTFRYCNKLRLKRISYSLRILFADFYKLFKCRFFNKIPENLQKMFVNNERFQKLITEEDNIFSMIRVNFYFLNLFHKQLTTQIGDFLKVHFALKLNNFTSLNVLYVSNES